MKIFKKIMLSVLVMGGTGSAAFGMEDSDLLNEITFKSWLDTPKDTSTMLKILELFNGSVARQSDTYSAKVSKILKLHGNAMSGQLDAIQEMKNISERGGLNVNGVSWFIPGERVVAIKTDFLRGNFEALKEIIKDMQSRKMFKKGVSMRLFDEHIKIIFLEDCMDEDCMYCENNLEVFATAALLALKNPGQVLMRTRNM